MSLQLATTGDAVALAAVDHGMCTTEPVTAAPAATTITERIEHHLAAATAPLTATAIRKLCQIRNATLQMALAALVTEGRIRKDRTGYVIAS